MISVPSPALGPEFNDFLFAPIGEDINGTLVSMLSGLARSDVDPWQEAAKLAQLPGEVATTELAALIDALPDDAVLNPDPHKIATRLIALLPRPVPEKDGSQHALFSTTREKLTTRPWWVYVVFMCFSLGTQFLIANHQIPAKPHNRETSALSGEPQPVSPTSGTPLELSGGERRPIAKHAQ
jgi:hypothetical protein